MAVEHKFNAGASTIVKSDNSYYVGGEFAKDLLKDMPVSSELEEEIRKAIPVTGKKNISELVWVIFAQDL